MEVHDRDRGPGPGRRRVGRRGMPAGTGHRPRSGRHELHAFAPRPGRVVPLLAADKQRYDDIEERLSEIGYAPAWPSTVADAYDEYRVMQPEPAGAEGVGNISVGSAEHALLATWTLAGLRSTGDDNTPSPTLRANVHRRAIPRTTTSHSVGNSVERASRHFPNPSPTESIRAFRTHAPAANPQVSHVAATYNRLHAVNFGKQVEHHRPHLENTRKPQVRAPSQ
ncbi:hypothetical protein GCM10023238_11240 [Streptomyces heliomycini]